MIERIEIQEYGPIKKVDVALTPLHAFIGPNDSGKSSLLRGMITGIARQNTPYWPTRDQQSLIHTRFTDGSTCTVAFNGANPGDRGERNEGSMSGGQGSAQLTGNWKGADQLWTARGAQLVRLDADALRQPSQLVTEENASGFLLQRGGGLPAIYDVLLNRNDDSFAKINSEFIRLFSTAIRLRLLTVGPTQKTLAVDLKSGKIIPATQMSEGMLYFLAFAALRHLGAGGLVAVEEPENGLHPARIAEIVRILRAMADGGTQVIVATHSPILLNEMRPEDVSVVTRTEENGTMVQRLSATPNFDIRTRVYKPGDLWVSYANGTDESPLLDAGVAGESRK